MSADSSKIIQITHVINPHLFWFKYKNTENAGVEELELALKNYVAEVGHKMLAIYSDDGYKSETYVVVYMKSKKKWIRAEIDDPSITSDKVIVWATDYGIPLQKSTDSIILLSEELKDLCHTTKSAIIQGGIAEIFPASNRLVVRQYCTFYILDLSLKFSIELVSEHDTENGSSEEMGATFN